MPKDDRIYAGHMLDLARKVVARVSGETRSDYDSDEDLRIVLVHWIQTIGEAARNVSRPFQEAHREIPWSQIIGMRHRIVHSYLDVDYDLVWDLSTEEIPSLIQTLERIVEPKDC